MEQRPGRSVRPPRTRANRPEVITRRSKIVGYHEAGKSIREISRLLGISRDTVRLWVRRYEAEGHVLTRPRSGQPRITTPDEDDEIRREAERQPLTTAVNITRNVGLRCHPVTVRRRLKEAGLNCYIPARKETLSEVHREARLRFAQAYVNREIELWRSTIFTDEKTFCSVSAFGRQCWRLRKTRFARRNIYETSRSGRVSVSFHGWMWWGGVGELTNIEGHLDGEQYVHILETSFLPSVRAYAIPHPQPIYMVQDLSPIHTCRVVRRWFAAHPEIVLLDWPPKGADCNPIENLWAYMVQEWHVEQKTRREIERKATEVWEGVRNRPNLCSNLVDSLQRRLQEVIDANGGWTHY